MKKIALVTGGSRGIGAAVCRAFNEEGYHVIVHYSQSSDKAEKLAQEISGEAMRANFERDDDIANLVSLIEKKHGRIDALVNNAGIADCESLSEITRDVFFKTMQVNLWAHVFLTKLISPLLKQGSIVFTSSVCAQLPTSDALAYAASKAGIEAIVRSISAEFAPRVRVNAVAPAATDTDMMKKNYSAEDVEWVRETFPMKRPCDPEDIADMISFLVSDKAKNITGQIFTVDAGASTR